MDNFFTRLFRREADASPQTDTGSTQRSVKGANWESDVTPVYGMRSLLVPAWYRGVSLLMQTMGQMRVQWQRINKEGGNFTEDKWGPGRKINYLLQVRPNPLMTASEMQEQIEFRKIYFGNAYVYIQRDSYGDIEALYLCTGGGYNPMTDTYSITFNRPGGPWILSEVPSRNILHFKNVFEDYGMYHGLPLIDFAKKALQISATADDQTLKDMAKGGRHKIIVQEEKSPTMGMRGRASKQELKNVTEQLAEDWRDNDVMMLDNIAGTQIISQSAQELRILEQRGFQVADLARLLGIPKIMMMEGDGGSYRMPEHATQEFMLRTIQPRIREWEDEMNSKLLSVEDFGKRRIHVCELPLRRLDAKGQAEIDEIHLRCGWSPNQILNQYDLPAIADGDSHYLSTNLAEVGSEKLRSNGGGRPAENNNIKDTKEGGAE